MIAAAALLLAITAFTAVPPPHAPFAIDTTCLKLPWGSDTIPDDERQLSPLDSVTFHVGGKPVKICYGRPSVRGRTIFGGRVPYGGFWRTGANEPTIFYTPLALSVAGLAMPPGVYWLYTLPGETEWTIFFNRFIPDWGSDGIIYSQRKHELGQARVKREWPPHHIETFTIRAESTAADTTVIVLEWERNRIRIPVAPG